MCKLDVTSNGTGRQYQYEFENEASAFGGDRRSSRVAVVGADRSDGERRRGEYRVQHDHVRRGARRIPELHLSLYELHLLLGGQHAGIPVRDVPTRVLVRSRYDNRRAAQAL